MKDLTRDSIASLILATAAPVAMTMLTQIVRQLINLYFLTRVGVAATAGVSTAGSSVFILTALVQVLGVGAVALIAHAVGREDHADANLLFNQAMALAMVCGAVTVALFYTFIRLYLQSVAADAAVIAAGVTYIHWVLPVYFLTLPITVFSFALRGTGIVLPTFVIQTFTVITNSILAPFSSQAGTPALPWVQGCGRGHQHFRHPRRRCDGRMLPSPAVANVAHTPIDASRSRSVARILGVGLPAGSEFVLTFLSTAVVYYTIRDFGASAQAGLGIGSSVMQTAILPGMSVADAAGPIAGQNFGAGNSARAYEKRFARRSSSEPQ